MTTVNQVPNPPLQVPVVDKSGRMSRPWAIYNRELYNYLAFKGGNSISDLGGRITENESDIAANALSIVANTESIQTNTDNLSGLNTEFDTHVALESAHGSNGNIVGFNDEATQVLFGLVKKMYLVANASASTASATGDPGSAPVAYSQAYADDQTALAESCKDAVNTLVADVNNVVTKLNDLIAKSKTAGQMNTT